MYGGKGGKKEKKGKKGKKKWDERRVARPLYKDQGVSCALCGMLKFMTEASEWGLMWWKRSMCEK
jgi:hypothetical protein